MIDLTAKRFQIYGLPGSGKSVLAKSILSTDDLSIIYDPLREYRGYRRYTPDDPQSVEELDTYIQDKVIPTRPHIFIIDEASIYITPKSEGPLPPAVKLLNDTSRHLGISWGVIARRPVQINPDLRELAHFLFLFRLPGRLDKNLLNEHADGLGTAVSRLKKHHFIIYDTTEGEYWEHAPVPYVDEGLAGSY